MQREAWVAENYCASERVDDIFSNWHRRLENVIGEEHGMVTVQTIDIKIILHSMLWR